MFKINNKKIAFIGLVVLFACSFPIVRGRRQPEIYSLPQLIPLNSDERMMIDSTFIQSGDRGEIAKYQRRWDKFESHPLLTKIFPKTKIYKLYSAYTDPSTSYIFSFYNGQFNTMPAGFNRLLLDCGLEVTDKNLIELAKTFVVIAFMFDPHIMYWEGEQYIISAVKEISFLEGKSSVDKKKVPSIYRVHLKVMVNKEIQIYDFNVQNGQIQWAAMKVEGKTVTKYFDLK